MIEYENLLNPQQLEAVKHKDGPLLILAGAGSGKTRVITYRIAYLIQEYGVHPANILAITFTNKAAREMQERTEGLIEGRTGGMWINTFHAVCGRILRSHGELLGYTRNFIIYDDTETKTVIKDCLKRMNLDEKRYPVNLIKAAISSAKDEMLTPAEYKATVPLGNKPAEVMANIYEMYQRTLETNNAMDFDDMILKTIDIFKEYPEVLEYYQERFLYIMVDEYQDTNKAQFEFVRLLAQRYGNLCVVGDDDQSIYSFRGADISNILNFEKNYKGCKVIKLEENYRSTQNILNAANGIIQNNRGRKGKRLWTSNGDGEKVFRYTAGDQNDEAYFITQSISAAVRQGKYKYSDFTILYRINALSQNLESAFTRRGIPYRVYGGLKFFDRKEIKDIIAYLRLVYNTRDDLALRRIINVPARGIGKTTLSNIEELAGLEQVSMFQICASANQYPGRLGRGADGKLLAFAAKISLLAEKVESMGIAELVETVINESGMLDEYKAENTVESETRIQNLQEFISVAKEFEADQRELEDGDASFSGFLQSVALSSDMDDEKGSADCVTMMTIHNAKGLEFPIVFVIGMEEGVFPSFRSFEELNGLDEERRLCYVAITRAKEELYLINAASRMLYGKTSYNVPSRFLNELPPESCEIVKGSFVGRAPASVSGRSDELGYRKSERKPSFGSGAASIRSSVSVYGNFRSGGTAAAAAAKPAASYAIGQRVTHKKYGEGTVEKIEGSGDNAKIEILFDEFGPKRFMLAFANLD